ncbi:unnamed protein product [Moneuplotes crassus]|uniref:Uncharacterized protein n=1 Tax=Euplotes crassus TaxID=5936 RepID=A0AAD1UJ62_EUPCR|nr:unnamed protein product [Moneuplotes crassus]
MTYYDEYYSRRSSGPEYVRDEGVPYRQAPTTEDLLFRFKKMQELFNKLEDNYNSSIAEISGEVETLRDKMKNYDEEVSIWKRIESKSSNILENKAVNLLKIQLIDEIQSSFTDLTQKNTELQEKMNQVEIKCNTNKIIIDEHKKEFNETLFDVDKFKVQIEDIEKQVHSQSETFYDKESFKTFKIKIERDIKNLKLKTGLKQRNNFGSFAKESDKSSDHKGEKKPTRLTSFVQSPRAGRKRFFEIPKHGDKKPEKSSNFKTIHNSPNKLEGKGINKSLSNVVKPIASESLSLSSNKLRVSTLSEKKEDLDIFVKVSETFAKVLTRREDLINFHAQFSSTIDKYKISHGIFKTPQLMSDEERERYHEFVRMEDIKKEIQEKINFKGSKIAPIGSPSSKNLATIKEDIQMKRTKYKFDDQHLKKRSDNKSDFSMISSPQNSPEKLLGYNKPTLAIKKIPTPQKLKEQYRRQKFNSVYEKKSNSSSISSESSRGIPPGDKPKPYKMNQSKSIEKKKSSSKLLKRNKVNLVRRNTTFFKPQFDHITNLSIGEDSNKSGVPQALLVGLDDLDEEFHERMDIQEAKLKNIEIMNKKIDTRISTIEIELTRKLMSTLSDANTIKEEVDHSIKMMKRDRNQVIHVGKSLEGHIQKTLSEIENFRIYYKKLDNKIDLIIKDLEIQTLLDTQDEIDRHSISLMGVFENTTRSNEIPSHKPIEISKNCISCSSYKSFALKSFKLACLSYTPSTIGYMSKELTRIQMHKLRSENLQKLGIKMKFPDKERISTLIEPHLSKLEFNSPVQNTRNLKFNYKKRNLHSSMAKKSQDGQDSSISFKFNNTIIDSKVNNSFMGKTSSLTKKEKVNISRTTMRNFRRAINVRNSSRMSY